MNLLKAPARIDAFTFLYTSYDSIPPYVFDSINRDLARVLHPQPLVSIVIPARQMGLEQAREMYLLTSMFVDQFPHDTKTSTNG